MNLANAGSSGAGESGSHGGKAIGLDGLECASGNGGRPGKSSLPEGPGETAREESATKKEGGGKRHGVVALTHLLNMVAGMERV